MITDKTTQKIFDIFAQNGINLDRHFPRLMERGYGSDTCQELSDEIVTVLRNIAETGINGKFDGSMKKTAIELSKIAVELSDKNAPKRLVKYQERVDALKNAPYCVTPNYSQNAMHGAVKTYITETIRGAQAMLGQTSDIEQQGYLNSIIDKLQAIDKAFDEGVWDKTSLSAVTIQNNIVSEFREIRRIMNARMVNAYTLDHLDKIEKAVAEWSGLLGVSRKNPKAKADAVALFEMDDLVRVSDSDETYTNANTFFRSMDVYARQTEEICSTVELDKEREELQKSIDELNAELTAIASKILNGEDPVRLFAEKQRIDDKIQRQEERLARVDDKIQIKLDNRSAREETIFRIERIRDVFELSSHSRSLIYKLFHNTDFAQLASLLDPSSDPSTLRDSIRNLYEVFARQQIIDKNGQIQREQLSKLEGMIKETEPKRKTTVEIQRETEQKEKEKNDIAEQMRKWAEAQAKVKRPTAVSEPTTQTQEQTQETLVDTLLSADDN